MIPDVLKIEFTALPPMPAPRVRVAEHAYNDPKYTSYKKSFATFLRNQNRGLYNYLKDLDPKTKKEIQKTTRYYSVGRAIIHRDVGDDDNYLKPVYDSIKQAGLILDDKYIMNGGFPSVHTKALPAGIYLWLFTIEKEDCLEISDYLINNTLDYFLG